MANGLRDTVTADIDYGEELYYSLQCRGLMPAAQPASCHAVQWKITGNISNYPHSRSYTQLLHTFLQFAIIKEISP